MDIEIRGTRYTISNYYSPNDDNTSHAKKMIETIEKIGNISTITCGDFNFMFNIAIDKLGGNNTTNTKCRKVIKDWMDESNIQDIWRIKHPGERKYTWVSNT